MHLRRTSQSGSIASIANLNVVETAMIRFLPRCMECRLGLILYSDENSVRLSVCLSNACIVTKRKKDVSRFLYHTKDHLA